MSATRDRCWEVSRQFYPLEKRPGVLHRNRILETANKGKEYLEIGCGRDAQLLRQVAPFFGYSRGLDLEIGDDAPRGDNFELIAGDAHSLPLPDNSTDTVSCKDVIEHLSDPATWLGECARVLRPGGRLVFSTVNKNFAPILLGRVFPHRLRQHINRIATGTEDHDTFPTFYRANNATILRRLGIASGFRVETLEYVSHRPLYFTFSLPIYRAAVRVERIVRARESLAKFRHLIQGVFVAS